MKFRSSLIAVAVATAFSSSAFALVATPVDFDAATGAVPLASQIGMTDANPLAPVAALNWTAKLGFGVSAGSTRYIVVKYNNATLDTAHGSVAGTDIEINNGAAADTFAVVQGGAIGDAYVIYQFTADAGGAGLTAAAVLDVLTPALRVTNSGSAVTVAYSLHETAVSAVAEAAGGTGAAKLYSKTGNLTSAASALAFSLATSAQTAAVETVFYKFCATSATDCASSSAVLTKKLGTVTYDSVNTAAAGTAKRRDAATDAILANIVTTADVIVAGDFSAAGSIFIDNDGDATDCNASSITGTLNTAKTSATFVVNTTPSSATGMKVCYTVNGTTAIPEQTVTASLDVKTTPTDVTTADVASATLGTIARDGTELQAPWMSKASGFVSRVFLTNKGTTDATITNVRVLTETGNTCTVGTGAPTTIGAGKMVEYTADAICGNLSGNQRFAPIFTIAAPTASIQGVMQIINSSTLAQTATPLLRPGTN